MGSKFLVTRLSQELSSARPLAHPFVAQRALSPGVRLAANSIFLRSHIFEIFGRFGSQVAPAVVSQPIPSPQALQAGCDIQDSASWSLLRPVL